MWAKTVLALFRTACWLIESANVPDTVQSRTRRAGKSVYDDVSEKKKKSDTDPTYSENMKLSIKIMERIFAQILWQALAGADMWGWTSENRKVETYSPWKFMRARNSSYLRFPHDASIKLEMQSSASLPASALHLSKVWSIKMRRMRSTMILSSQVVPLDMVYNTC